MSWTDNRNGTFLAPRQLEALFWRGRGVKRAEAAAKMGVSVKTFDVYTQRAVNALGVTAWDMPFLLLRGGEFTRKQTLDVD